jgi:hypothetical protein
VIGTIKIKIEIEMEMVIMALEVAVHSKDHHSRQVEQAHQLPTHTEQGRSSRRQGVSRNS